MGAGGLEHSGNGAPAVVVGVDESASARDAAEWAADLAAAWMAPFALVHVVLGWPQDDARPEIPPWLHELADAAERSGVRDVTIDVVPGGLVETLAGRGGSARMLVVGSYGEGAWTGMLAGAAAITLIDRTTCPVAVVRGSAPQVPPPRGGPVVVGVDGSPASDAAVDLAAELAASLGSRLVTVQAVSAVPVDVAATRLAVVRERYPALPLQQQLVAGSAQAGLGAHASEARMLVIGRHVPGESGDSGVVLGAIGHGLVESAPCPVVIAAHPRSTTPAIRPHSEHAGC
jgi:nucleotide-binding universal stress UspA family protein